MQLPLSWNWGNELANWLWTSLWCPWCHSLSLHQSTTTNHSLYKWQSFHLFLNQHGHGILTTHLQVFTGQLPFPSSNQHYQNTPDTQSIAANQPGKWPVNPPNDSWGKVHHTLITITTIQFILSEIQLGQQAQRTRMEGNERQQNSIIIKRIYSEQKHAKERNVFWLCHLYQHFNITNTKPSDAPHIISYEYTGYYYIFSNNQNIHSSTLKLCYHNSWTL